MKSLQKKEQNNSNLRKISNDKRGVFGLTAVQQFFAVLLGVALLAYVIVIIMGTLLSANITTNAVAGNGTQNILGNVSNGVVSFFTSINPVYAILAVLVIILILVVLVRVVTGGTAGGGGTPQL